MTAKAAAHEKKSLLCTLWPAQQAESGCSGLTHHGGEVEFVEVLLLRLDALEVVADVLVVREQLLPVRLEPRHHLRTT